MGFMLAVEVAQLLEFFAQVALKMLAPAASETSAQA